MNFLPGLFHLSNAAELQSFFQVFKKVFIPRTLDDVVDYERDLRRVQKGIDTEYVSLRIGFGMYWS